MIRKSCAAGALTIAVSCLGLAPAVAAPNPSPVAPEHTGTACMAVLGHNPQTTPNATQAPQGAANFLEVGVAMCGL